MESIFEILMDLPLFQGVSREKLSELIEKTPFHFLKYADGEHIIASGEPCTHVKFIISGAAIVDTASNQRRVTISETMSAPAVIGPEYLFGLETRYPFKATAKGTCGVLQITKADYLTILNSDKVFIFNVLNILSRKAQKSASNLLALSSGSIAERLSFLILSLTHHGSTDIRITFKQKDLCSILGTQRSSFVSAITKMQEDGIIKFSLSEIEVNDRNMLLDILHTDD